ncbi:MAG: transporter substrate-binding domain-containing protein [Alphaproteobacteria bacterium]
MKQIVTIVLAVLASVLSVKFLLPQGGEAAVAKETAYERVMRTGVLRCGYGLWPHAMERDVNTGKMSGIIVEITEALAASLNLKVEWASEVDWGQIPTALDTQKIDMHCAGLWADPGKARGMAFSDPIFFSKVSAIARADDTRFDNNMAAMNKPEIKTPFGDGEINLEIAMHDIPLATRVPKASVNGDQGLLQDVAFGRADVTFSNSSEVMVFNANNPDKQLKVVPLPKPVRLFANTYGLGKDEHTLRNMLNVALHVLQENGQLDKILAKYKGKGAELFTPVQRRYSEE